MMERITSWRDTERPHSCEELVRGLAALRHDYVAGKVVASHAMIILIAHEPKAASPLGHEKLNSVQLAAVYK
jgi:hypothetical protein